MRSFGISMEVTCNVEEVLGILRNNLAEHADMVQEARTGYVEQAKIKLEEELGRIANGSLKGLYVHLDPPRDYTSQYETVIKMLEMHSEELITLNANEVRMFIEDKWDWSHDFIGTNSAYSCKTAALAE